MPELPWCPVTVEANDRPPMIKVKAIYDANYDEGQGMLLYAGNEGSASAFTVREILANTGEEFRFNTNGGIEVTVRATVPDDSARGKQFPTLPYDLPVEVIGAIVSDTIDTSEAYLSAAVDNEGDVHTVVLVTPLGLYARYSKQWIKLTDVSTISHLNVVDIPPEDLNLYDEADINGEMLNISAMNPAETTAIEFIEPVPAPVTASAPTRSVIIASLDDVPAAIQFAQTPEGWESRWYVGRRARALGWADPFPWEEK
jgi:hypothetical protein